MSALSIRLTYFSAWNLTHLQDNRKCARLIDQTLEFFPKIGLIDANLCRVLDKGLLGCVEAVYSHLRHFVPVRFTRRLCPQQPAVFGIAEDHSQTCSVADESSERLLMLLFDLDLVYWNGVKQACV